MSSVKPDPQTPAFFETDRKAIDAALANSISELTEDNSCLAKAIHYSTLLGGKRIRPILTLATAGCFAVDQASALPVACAVELIHAYSLIHDDLPAMDDDDLRRGQPTCHRAFDEATAILAGDALQSMAFELIASNSDFSSDGRLRMMQALAKASGARGMVLGQAIDFESVGKNLNLEQLQHMHRKKTGALIEASVLLGAFCGDATESELNALKTYAQAIGLAFQVQDDILDITSNTETLGKRQGADMALNKPTYPSLLGLDGARSKLAELHHQASEALTAIQGKDTRKLTELCDFIVSRRQ